MYTYLYFTIYFRFSLPFRFAIHRLFAIIGKMETKFNDALGTKKRRGPRAGWQDRLPVKPVLFAIALVLLLAVFVLVNRPTTSVLNSAELDMLKSKGVLRIGVDTDLYGIAQNGEGLSYAIGTAMSDLVFGSTDNVTFASLERYSAPYKMADGEIDLAIMAMQSFQNESYAASTVPFFTDECVLLSYDAISSLAGKTVAVLQGTPSEKLLYTYLDEQQPELVVHLAADYYSMMVLLRAGTVDGLAVPRTVAMGLLESGMQIGSLSFGKIPYYAIAPKDSVLLSLCDELFLDWQSDGTFAGWYVRYGIEWGGNG